MEKHRYPVIICLIVSILATPMLLGIVSHLPDSVENTVGIITKPFFLVAEYFGFPLFGVIWPLTLIWVIEEKLSRRWYIVIAVGMFSFVLQESVK